MVYNIKFTHVYLSGADLRPNERTHARSFGRKSAF